MQNHTSNTPPIECTINMYGCNAPLDVPAVISIHPDTDCNGLYLSVRSPADNAPLAGFDLTPDQALQLATDLLNALTDIHLKAMGSKP